MTRALLVFGTLCACAASAAPARDPEPAPASDPPSASDHPPSAPEPQSPPAPRPEAVLPQARTVPGFKGFWCTELRDRPDQPEYISECYRLKETCDFQFEKGQKAGRYMTECKPADHALCFEMTEAVRMRIHVRCYDTVYRCKVERVKFQRDYPDFHFGECVLTASLPAGPVPGHPRAASAAPRLP